MKKRLLRVLGQQRLIEKSEHLSLVFLRVREQAVDVGRVWQFPQLFWFASDGVIDPVDSDLFIWSFSALPSQSPRINGETPHLGERLYGVSVASFACHSHINWGVRHPQMPD
jgi:hypothetical protein